MKYIIYKTTNLINNKFYIGQHITKNINDGYLGSGKSIIKAIKKYGKENFKKEILFIFDNFDDMDKKEIELVDEKFIQNENTYNIALGGIKNTSRGKVTVKDKDGNTFQIDKDDPRYLNGELISFFKNKLNVKDKDGNTFQIDKDDPRYLNGELVGCSKNKVVVKDKDGNTFQVDTDDYRIKNNKLMYVSKNKVVVKDKDGNTFQVDINDERYLNGELVTCCKNKVVVKDKDGNTFQIDKDDPRYLNGELVGCSSGYTSILDENGKTIRIKSEYYNPSIHITPSTGKVSVYDSTDNKTKSIKLSDFNPSIHKKVFGGIVANGKYVSKEEYYSNPNLKTHTTGYTSILDENGKTIRIKSEDYNPLIHKTPSSGKITCKNKNTGNYESIDKDYYENNKDKYEATTSGQLTVYIINEKRFTNILKENYDRKIHRMAKDKKIHCFDKNNNLVFEFFGNKNEFFDLIGNKNEKMWQCAINEKTYIAHKYHNKYVNYEYNECYFKIIDWKNRY